MANKTTTDNTNAAIALLSVSLCYPCSFTRCIDGVLYYHRLSLNAWIEHNSKENMLKCLLNFNVNKLASNVVALSYPNDQIRCFGRRYMFTNFFRYYIKWPGLIIQSIVKRRSNVSFFFCHYFTVRWYSRRQSKNWKAANEGMNGGHLFVLCKVVL